MKSTIAIITTAVLCLQMTTTPARAGMTVEGAL